jgi:hypothetical protein
MVIFLILVGFLAFILFKQITPAFLANPGLNGLILGVLLIAVLIAFGQVFRLYREVSYVNAVASGGQAKKPPALLAPMVPMIAATSASWWPVVTWSIACKCRKPGARSLAR